MAMAALLLVGADDRLVLKSLYNPDLVTALKDAVPYGHGEWDGATKVWRIDPGSGDVVLDALEAVRVTVVDKRPAIPAPTVVAHKFQEACRRLTILPEAPLAVAEAAYKAWALLCHPDVGGGLTGVLAFSISCQ